MMENKTISRWVFVILLVAVAGLFFGGCATMGEKPKPALVATDQGTAIYEDKYEFKAPVGWKLLRGESEGDFEFGFLKFENEKGDYPSQSTFIYDDEPFGSSRDLDTRAKQYCTRFLWLSGMFPEVKKQDEVQLWGQPAIAIYLEGENPTGGEKAKSLVYLVKKGTRIISFALTQWRPMSGAFDSGPFEQFETFVKSFKFLKPTFYEEIEEKIKKLKSDD
jgi:hypothetical protein